MSGWQPELHDNVVRLSDGDRHIDFHLVWLRDELGASTSPESLAVSLHPPHAPGVTMSDYAPYLIVPGWGGSAADHWQTHWQRDLGATRVELANWHDPRPTAWTNALETALAVLASKDPRPPVIVAHSLGCITLAHWARTHRREIRAALLVAPADVETSCAHRLGDFGPIPRRPLPFHSTVIASDDDPNATLARAASLAASWGSDFIPVAKGGHLNPASNLGRWWLGRAQLARLLQRTDLALSA